VNKQHTIQKILALKHQFDQIMDQHRFQYWMDMDLTTLQFKCLFYISQTGIATSRKLSQALGVTPADVTGVIVRLIAQGFIQRQEKPDDRRFYLLQATDKGKFIIEKLSRIEEDYLTKKLEGLDEEELNHVLLGLCAISRNMNERKQNRVISTNSEWLGENEPSLFKNKER
jgi:DNA-binding MarR family transcriptional regulator